jgi:hypothetical protein
MLEATTVDTMELVTIAGVDILFPFKPYPLQKAFMNQVLMCLKNVTFFSSLHSFFSIILI